jgi:ribose 1,5-bisphosphokinase
MTMARLFYVIGASGAGKDSLIHYIRHNMPGNAHVVFAHRYITRAADAGGENHVALTEQEFMRRKQQGCFAMYWFSHESHYGIGIEIDAWLSLGLDVVVNGSRGYLQQAADRYPNITPVLISVDPDVLGQRLFSRGRETIDQIEQRLVQAIKLEKQVKHPQLIRIENNDGMEDAGQQFLHAILERDNIRCA